MIVRKITKFKDPRVDAQINELIRVINAFGRRAVNTENQLHLLGGVGELRIRSAASGKAFVLRYVDDAAGDYLEISYEG